MMRYLLAGLIGLGAFLAGLIISGFALGFNTKIEDAPDYFGFCLFSGLVNFAAALIWLP